MPIITFWSNNEKTIGQTVSAVATATVMAIEHNYKILLISADFKNNTMENCLGAQQSNKDLLKSIIVKPHMNLDTGISGLLKIAQSNRVTPEIIKDYTKIIYKNRLEAIYSSNNEEISIEEQLEYYKTIIMNASKYYDYVIVDLKKGMEYRQILDILDISTAIVLNTEQGMKTLEVFLQNPKLQKYINEHRVIWNICRYDEKSKYNTKNLTRTIWKRQQVFNIPYNTLLFESGEEGTLAEVLLKLRSLKSEDENKKLYEEIMNLVQGIFVKYQELQMRM